jgi:tyrosyl-tRNA synthetase
LFDLDEAFREIQRGSVEIIDEKRVKELLTSYLKSGETFYVKAGFDPTAPDLHLGHTVLIQKLALFQKYGAIVQFIIGDFTGMIGDPTGKNETRKKLDKKSVLENAKSYKEQVFMILDPKKTEVLFNSKWIDELGASGMLELTTTFNVARMLEREDFFQRYKSQTPISISEFLYPLLQGYDSVVLKSDIELGGSDQKFNLLMGRTLQRSYNVGKEQAILMMPLLEGLDGVNKMSKSLNNYIGVAEDANSMFGKILSISDSLMWRYYELLSTKTLDEIEVLKENVKSGSLHPKLAKEQLAIEIIERFHNEQKAKIAKEEFNNIHKQNLLPTNIESFELSGPIWIAKALVDTKLEPSTSNARRDIKQGAVKIDQVKVSDEQLQLQSGTYTLQVGKRKFANVKVK